MSEEFNHDDLPDGEKQKSRLMLTLLSLLGLGLLYVVARVVDYYWFS